MCSFNYLNPYLDKIFAPYQRYQRIVVTLTLVYTSFLIFMLHQVRKPQSSCGNVEAAIWKSHAGVPRPESEHGAG
jgi:hypothetical protein